MYTIVQKFLIFIYYLMNKVLLVVVMLKFQTRLSPKMNSVQKHQGWRRDVLEEDGGP